MNLPDTVTVLNPRAVTDRYGNSTETWDTPTAATVPAWVGPARTTETTADGDLVVTTLVCDLMPAAPVTPRSRIRWRGETYEIDGQPMPVMRRGVLHHYELTLKRAEG